MKSFVLLTVLLAVFAVSNAQYTYNIVLQRPYYNYEVSMMADQYLSQQGSYGSYYSYIQYAFPYYWDQYWYSYLSLGQQVAQNNGMWTDQQWQELARHVIQYRENYTDFPISSSRMIQQHVDWAQGNYTFVAADFAVFLTELDAGLRLAKIILQDRPECGMSDEQTFTSEITQRLQQSIDQYFSYAMSSGSYLQGLVNQEIINIFPNMFSTAVYDMYDPLSAIKRLELVFFETHRALLRKQLNNLSRALSWYINANLLVYMTNERNALLNSVRNAGTYACQYPDPPMY